MRRIKCMWPYTIAVGCLLVVYQLNWRKLQCVDPDDNGSKDTDLDHGATLQTSYKSVTNPIRQVRNGQFGIEKDRKQIERFGERMIHGATEVENRVNSGVRMEAELREYHVETKESETILEMRRNRIGKERKLSGNYNERMQFYRSSMSDNQPKHKLKLCPKTLAPENIELSYHQSPSGLWTPSACRPRHVIAVVVPYRDREAHLRTFSEFMPNFLQRQWVAYHIIVIEQVSPNIFNRGYILNIGFTEVQKLVPGIGCVIFHDVDLLPENNTIRYSCYQEPFHLAAYVNSSNYRSTPGITGGVLAITPHQMQQVNGYSNIYWGWGGEDADLYNRLSAQGIRVLRGDAHETRYKMLPHGKDRHNPVILKRFASQLTDWTEDGLNSMNYSVTSVNRFQSHTHIAVRINVDERTEKWLQEKYKMFGHA